MTLLDERATFGDMKTLFALFLTIAAASAQWSDFRGDYLGVVMPSGSCSNERWTANFIIQADGYFHGNFSNWDGIETNHVSGYITARGRFLEETDGTNSPGWTVKGIVGKASGKLSGTLDGRYDGGCRYTFTLYRRFKVAQ